MGPGPASQWVLSETDACDIIPTFQTALFFVSGPQSVLHLIVQFIRISFRDSQRRNVAWTSARYFNWLLRPCTLKMEPLKLP
jgi:hypothetical protein